MTTEEAEGYRPIHGRQTADGRLTPLVASYVNFFIGNSVVVFPLLDPRHDEEVAAILAEELPHRHVQGVAAREILLGGGGIHCITQQVPAIGKE